MKILIIGSGGREHAIAKALLSGKLTTTCYVAPGNAGTSTFCTNVPIKENQIKELIQFAKKEAISITFVGPEAPLVDGIVDAFQKENLAIIGPSKESAQLEGSKDWAKSLMKKYNIPTANFETFTSFETSLSYIKNKNTYPIVIKADGLAAGKGVTIAQTYEQAENALKDCFINNKFNDAGQKVVIEDFLKGEEASIFAFTDGKSILCMEPAQDHKAIFDGDKGPNTGGMGAYCPAPIVSKTLQETIKKSIFEPLLEAFKKENLHYTGIIYAGLMIDNQNANIVEFNVRFGDPETQVVLPQLKTDLAEIFQHIINQSLDQLTLEWHNKSTVAVVMASGGYPDSYEKNKTITGLNNISSDCHIIHAGTKKEKDNIVTNGGRVLCVVGQDETLESAIKKTYTNIKKIEFDNAYYRTDIGQKALK